MFTFLAALHTVPLSETLQTKFIGVTTEHAWVIDLYLIGVI